MIAKCDWSKIDRKPVVVKSDAFFIRRFSLIKHSINASLVF